MEKLRQSDYLGKYADTIKTNTDLSILDVSLPLSQSILNPETVTHHQFCQFGDYLSKRSNV